MTVHILHEGKTLCGFGCGVVPADWPNDDKWVSKRHGGDATCDNCLSIFENKPNPFNLEIKFVSRNEVKKILLEYWKDAIAHAVCVGLPFRLPDWENLRNYEMEMLIGDISSEYKWVVSEWCPFDWIFCSYRAGASKKDLEIALDQIENENNDPPLYKVSLRKRINMELDRRPDDLDENSPWAEGVNLGPAY